MSLEAIRKKIQETRVTAERDVPENSKAKSGLEGAKNHAKVKLEELKSLYRDEIRKNTKLYLVYGPNVIYNVGTPPNVFVMNHKDLAYKLSTGVVNSIRGGTGLTSYHITPLNEMLTDICQDMGLRTSSLPSIGMETKFMSPIMGRDHLADTIESMLEFYMKSNDEEKAGHAVQSVYVAHNYLNLVENMEVDGELKLFVFAPTLDKDIKAVYGRFLTDNINTISFDNKVHAEQYFNNADELTNFINSLAVVKQTEKKKKGK